MPEMHDALFHYYCEFDAIALIDRFAVGDKSPSPELITNFLGVRIPPKVFPPVLDKMKGQVEPVPSPGNWHADIAEWSSALRSVDQCLGDTYRIVELGCGWGCWLVNMGSAARSRGLKVELIGVEGDYNHLDNAGDVLRMNGFTPEQFRLNHGIAGPAVGKAVFPDYAKGAGGWGGEAIFYPSDAILAKAMSDPSVQVLDCLTLDMLSDGNPIDLLHIDIQGAEVDYVYGNMDSIVRLVKRVLIGTHSRIIEGRLMDHFLSAGWRLEMDRSVIAPVISGKPETLVDGVQLWANPSFNAN